jgi:hypothetical protein
MELRPNGTRTHCKNANICACPLLIVQTVTVIAGTLQTAGLISYRRGVIHVLNRERLEAASCECYRVTTAFYDSIMKHPPSG